MKDHIKELYLSFVKCIFHMEVWSILKEHIEMTDELKLEQLYNMITTGYRYREEPHTEFKELLASMPVESVT